MKKVYITPELEETLIETDNVLTILPVSGAEAGGTTSEGGITEADAKFFGEELDEEEEW